MKKKARKIQQILVITGLVLFILTYFYYPSSIEEKSDNQVLIDENLEKKDMDASQVNSFENMEYKGVYDFNKSFIQTISNKIVNSIVGINRVVYDVTSKPPSTIELE